MKFRDKIRAEAERLDCNYRITKTGQVDFYGRMPNSQSIGWYFVGWTAREVCERISREAAETKHRDFLAGAAL